jgi:hypothetical protein
VLGCAPAGCGDAVPSAPTDCGCEGPALEAGSGAVGCASLVTGVTGDTGDTGDTDDTAAWSGRGDDPAFASV